MNKTKTIGWVRHGKTDWNALGKIQGQTDIPLNEEGIRQAQALAERLATEGLQWDGVVSSPLSRARETARMIAERLDIPLLAPDKRLQERGFGEIEGTTEQERISRWGEQWRQTYVGQESDEEVRERGFNFLQDWLEQAGMNRLLVVSHGSFLSLMLHTLCDNLDKSYIGNMSFSIMDYNGERWQSVLHNCTLHLC
ncbi:histidine phosphatase family protein [Paenibacillus sp. GCM10012307]|uniref:Histidine phosphatase family protein n=1 Tax=Paenibacillus roseus TaxID=2798579 RepID=A0A934JAN6_9BACL|nr:histidine phosphatase family protein [Paenibacillus roseus]MBJ6363547.1 histidine phosphatase family protein [Paenibacillus roseus]